MLLPALSKAREKARSISCVNNFKQMGLATQMYANDNDGFLFPNQQKWPEHWRHDIDISGWYVNAGVGNWAVYVCFRYLEEPEMLYCPSDEEHSYGDDTSWWNNRESQDWQVYNNNDVNQTYLSYLYKPNRSDTGEKDFTERLNEFGKGAPLGMGTLADDSSDWGPKKINHADGFNILHGDGSVSQWSASATLLANYGLNKKSEASDIIQQGRGSSTTGSTKNLHHFMRDLRAENGVEHPDWFTDTNLTDSGS